MHIPGLLISIWQKIDQLDKHLFILLNNGTRNHLFDIVFPYLRDSIFWAPFYLFIFLFVIVNFKNVAPWWILGFLCTIALTDMTGTFLIKQNIQRLRPCQDPAFMMHVHLVLKQCSGSYSFISNHAANHFGMAAFIALTLRKTVGSEINLVFLWAILIAFAQVYVGVHYPFDVLAGAILGICFGSITATIFNKVVHRHKFIIQNS
ncbi:MAG: phosphatase PAP2 family protein [Candidatus Dadabacteria bacterium]